MIFPPLMDSHVIKRNLANDPSIYSCHELTLVTPAKCLSGDEVQRPAMMLCIDLDKRTTGIARLQCLPMRPVRPKDITSGPSGSEACCLAQGVLGYVAASNIPDLQTTFILVGHSIIRIGCDGFALPIARRCDIADPGASRDNSYLSIVIWSPSYSPHRMRRKDDVMRIVWKFHRRHIPDLGSYH
jgi:hypothetical protein